MYVAGLFQMDRKISTPKQIAYIHMYYYPDRIANKTRIGALFSSFILVLSLSLWVFSVLVTEMVSRLLYVLLD